MTVRRKYICTLVARLLKEQNVNLTPIPVKDLATALGIDVRYEPADDKLSGFLMRDSRYNRAVIGVNSSHSLNRQRFTIAHEIGHFLLHEGEKLHVDRAGNMMKVQCRNDDSSKGINIEEKEANLFAAELLMPRQLIESDLAQIETLDLQDEEVLKKMAASYGVSIQALTFRLAYLNYIQI